MNTRRNADQILEEEIAYAGAPPLDEQVSPHEEDANVEQALTNPRSMMED